jgi:tetratricopeptide (TPR) repeat protein
VIPLSGVRPGTPPGWGWGRLATIAGVFGLLMGLAAVGSLWIKAAEPQTANILLIVTTSLALTGFFTAILGKLAELREKREKQIVEWRATVAKLLRETVHDRLPRLSELSDVVLGATETRYTRIGQAPYVERRVPDQRIRSLLGASGPPYPFIVIVGLETAGKSRTAIHAARKVFKNTDPTVIVPADGYALAELSRLNPEMPIRPMPALVWLDDLTAADLTPLSGTVLDSWSQRAFIVATTTRERWYQVQHSSGEVAAAARQAAEYATAVEIEFGLTLEEKTEACELYPEEIFDTSIAETLIGGEQLVAKYRAGQDTNPCGTALVQAAVDARRAGLSRPLTEQELKRLYKLNLRRIHINLMPDSACFENGLKWASEPVASQVALLRKNVSTAPVADWTALDYVVSADNGEHGHESRAVPLDVWDELIELVSEAEATDIGTMAYLRQHETQAFAALSKGSRGKDLAQASMAAFNLGVLLQTKLDDPTGARAAYQLAIESRHADSFPRAAVNLGTLLTKLDDPTGARAAFQLAINSQDSDQAPKAAFNLGLLLGRQGNQDEARAALQLAINSRHPDQAPEAAFALGLLLAEDHDPKGARAAYQLAFDSRHPNLAPKAALKLGPLLLKEGHLEGACVAYQLAVDSLDLDITLKDRVNKLLIDSRQPDHAMQAAVSLGVLLIKLGDPEGARAAYQLAIDSQDSDQAPIAAFNVGLMLEAEEDLEGARAAYQLSIDSGDVDHAPALEAGHHHPIVPFAAFHLGQLLEVKLGDPQRARAAYQLALDSGNVSARERLDRLCE